MSSAGEGGESTPIEGWQESDKDGVIRSHSHSDLWRARNLAQKRINEGTLPSLPVPELAIRPDEKHLAPCAVCGEPIRGTVWHKLNCDWPVPDPHQSGARHPELHALCFSLWYTIASENKRRGPA